MTSEIKKILVSIFLAFSISFGILALMIFYDQSVTNISTYPESKNDIPTIFLIGSSEIGALDVTFLNQDVQNSGNDYEIFNLAKTGDSPSKRINEIDSIISSNPSMVVYAIGYRDLSSYSNQNPLDIK